MALTVYTLATCEKCKAAKEWLRSRKIPFRVFAIRRVPPSRTELRIAYRAIGDPMHLVNTEHPDYFRRAIGSKIDLLSEDGVVELLLTNPDLIRRPFVVGERVILAGFDVERWEAALA